MPQIKDAAACKQLAERLKKRQHVRIPEFRQIIDRAMPSLLAIRDSLAPDYQKTFIPYMTGAPAKVAYRLTNIMASNQSEIRYKARSTEPTKISAVQRHEHGHEALDPLLFPITVRRKFYSFLTDGYTVVALDVTPKPGALAGYADREKLQQYAESDTEDDEADTPESSYRRAYKRTDQKRTAAERHEDAYDAATSEALIADGCSARVRVPDPLTFKGFQTDDDPCRFALGMEYGKKQLNPLLDALEDFGVKVDNGILWIDSKGKKTKSASYRALGVGMIADSQSATDGDEYVEYTQIRTCEETLILIENVKGAKDKDGQPGILIRVPNLFGGKSTGYYLIEGDAKLRSGDLEDRYDPPLLNLMNEAQHYSITRTGWEAMALAEMTRAPYILDESDGSERVMAHDPTQETKVAHAEDGAALPVSTGEVKRMEGFGQKMEALLEHAMQEMQRSEPTDIWGGTGSSSETGIAIARRETALLTELTPYQANVATVCKYIHIDVDQYIVSTSETMKFAYLPDSSSERKPELREITPETAKLAMDMDYTIGSDTPESKYAAEQMAIARRDSGVWGDTDMREAIGIKDPDATEKQMAIDRLMRLLLGTNETPGIVDDAFSSIMVQYAKAALEKELGPLPEPALPPQPGMPAAGGAPMNGAAPPTQTLPVQSNQPPGSVPVTPGGSGIVV